ncbi:MAG: carbon-nitrogen hydrolase family protein [Clostridiales bacterium]|nr:carbon-nitrogen hydrolase family protein [Clostridiales bacterium]
MQVSLLQQLVMGEKTRDLTAAAQAVVAAKARGADLAVLPEMFCCPYDTQTFPVYAEAAGGPIWQALSAIARENHIWLVGGTFPEREGERIYNACFVFDRQGRQAARYRKMHLFDIHIDGGQHFMESETLSPGEAPAVFETEFGVFGLAVCFDLRFPALFERTADLGAKAVFVPAAFNRTTGPRHWELLFRSRAVDNQLYTLGAAPAQNLSAGYVSYGHSIVCDPWGDVMAQAGTEPGAVDVTLDLNLVDEVRRQLPVRSARRPL